MLRTALIAIAIASATPAFANPADSSNPDERIEQGLAAACAPGLKFAEGACVRECPSGQEDRGRFCELRSSGDGGGDGGD
jgi:hypothetical protein